LQPGVDIADLMQEIKVRWAAQQTLDCSGVGGCAPSRPLPCHSLCGVRPSKVACLGERLYFVQGCRSCHTPFSYHRHDASELYCHIHMTPPARSNCSVSLLQDTQSIVGLLGLGERPGLSLPYSTREP
jgi:hypothetical protein